MDILGDICSVHGTPMDIILGAVGDAFLEIISHLSEYLQRPWHIQLMKDCVY